LENVRRFGLLDWCAFYRAPVLWEEKSDMRIPLILGVLMCAALLSPAYGATWVIGDAGLGDAANFVQETWWPGESGTLVSRADAAGDPGYDFVFKFAGVLPFEKVSVGDDYPVVASTGNSGNLTAYSTYEMILKNKSSGWFEAQLFVNTGYVPTPGDNAYMGDWVWLAPGETKMLTLDLSQCVYLNQVTNIGFRVGSDIGAGDYQMPADTEFAVGVVPEPGSMMSLATGLAVLGGMLIRRKQR